MKLGELPYLLNAVDLLGVDNGFDAKTDATIPDVWLETAVKADVELGQLTDVQIETLVMGEKEDMDKIVPKAPEAHKILDACFDGELSETFCKPWRSIHDARY